MACPYFYPTERLAESAWPKHPRLPLGDPYRGVCRADPLRELRPDAETLRECCNLGRAARRCPHFPKRGEADAVRFSVCGDDAGVVRIFYVAEREARSVEHGTIEFASAAGQLNDGRAGGPLAQQGRAYLESYLRRKHEPDEHSKHLHRR